jgi:8-oxo-dGTP pyrophosphatase MutT (NUDIX family)
MLAAEPGPPPETPIVPQLPADWRERLQRNLLREPDLVSDNYRLGGVVSRSHELRAHLQEDFPQTMRPAAVLIGIVDQATPSLLMTVRSQSLRQHAGQISFPGGGRDPSDPNITAAAIRETHEEIGIDPSFIQPIGFLTDHVMFSGFRVTPVVALVKPGFQLNPNTREVAGVFELPLGLVLAIESYRQGQRVVRELAVDVWELPFGEYHVCGATAGMLMNLCEVVSGARA